MSQLSIRWLIWPVVAALLLAVVVAQPQPELATGTEESADPELLAFGAELDAAQSQVRARIALKEHLIGELAEGRQTLDEVATVFLQLNQASEICMSVVRAKYPGATDEERIARNVIAFAVDRVRSPEAKNTLQTRLGREFEHHYGATP